MNTVFLFSLRKHKWSEFIPLPRPSSRNQAIVVEPDTLYNFDGGCLALPLQSA